jgi:hypothetical protein
VRGKSTAKPLVEKKAAVGARAIAAVYAARSMPVGPVTGTVTGVMGGHRHGGQMRDGSRDALPAPPLDCRATFTVGVQLEAYSQRWVVICREVSRLSINEIARQDLGDDSVRWGQHVSAG